MNNTVFLYLSQLRVFWWLRAGIKRALFWLEARVFGVRYNLQEEKSNYQSLRHLFSIAQTQLFCAIGFAALLQYVDSHLYSYYKAFHLKIPDDGDYVTLLATISGIGGVFIGLYYAGISMVGSSIYARVPNNIRDLLAQERFGNVYMRFLSFLTFLGLALIALRVIGYPRVYLAVPVATVAAGIGIIAFVKLGQRAFYLFDPTVLSYHIFEQLQHWLRMVKAGGFRWEDKSFQAHAHRQASATLDTLETLADITAKEVHLRGRPFIDLVQTLIRFLIHYERSKRYISSQSLWYEQRYQHRDWYRTEDSRVAIAHHTGTTLQPDIANDKEWLEARATPILKQCIDVNLAADRYNDVLGLLQYLETYVTQLAKEGRIERAFEILAELGGTILDRMVSTSGEQLVKDEVLEKLAVAERLASLPITVVIAYREVLETLDKNQTSQELSRIRWNDSRSIYKGNFPSYCLPRLEWFSPRLTFEKKVEGHGVSPLWYQTELLLQVEAEQLFANAKTLSTKGVSQYKKWITQTLGAKHPWLAAAIMSREWEYWHKVQHLFMLIPKRWNDLSEDRRIAGLPWPDLDNEKLMAENLERQNELLKQMSQQNILLSLLARPEDFPDFAGQFLHTSGEAVFDSLLNNNTDMLRDVFEPYLFGCFLKFNNLRPRTASTDWHTQQDFKIAAAALLDLMDVSGYARLMADYHDNEELWRLVVRAWDNYLAQEHAQSPLPLFAAAVTLTETAFELAHRSVLRTTWRQKINQKLMGVPRKKGYRREWLESDTVVEHKSPLVRIFGRQPFGSFHDGIDIIIGFYLCHREGADGLDFGWKRRHLMEKIEREKRNNPPDESGEENA